MLHLSVTAVNNGHGSGAWQKGERIKMSKVTFDYSKASSFVRENEVESMKKLALDAKEVLVGKTGAGNDFLGWIDLPVNYDKEELSAALISARGRRLNSCVTASTMSWTNPSERRRKSIS